MPGIAGIIFVLVLAAVILAWTIWVTGRAEMQKEATPEKDEREPPLPDT